MSNFAVQKISTIPDGGKIVFYKLLKDGKCLFDEFVAEVELNAIEKKSLAVIYTCMEYMALSDSLLPKNKCNSIKFEGKVIGLEFKKGNIRVYFVKKAPNAYIIIGGWKDKQNKSIEKFNRLINQAKDVLI